MFITRRSIKTVELSCKPAVLIHQINLVSKHSMTVNPHCRYANKFKKMGLGRNDKGRIFISNLSNGRVTSPIALSVI